MTYYYSISSPNPILSFIQLLPTSLLLLLSPDSFRDSSSLVLLIALPDWTTMTRATASLVITPGIYGVYHYRRGRRTTLVINGRRGCDGSSGRT
jgi:hypothetical protein